MMRITQIVLVGSLAALIASAAPAAAKNIQTTKSHAKADEQTNSSDCQAYQQAPDGSWTALPCQEPGAAPQEQHKIATGDSQSTTR